MVSIIVPVYNAEKYLKRCIESVRNQTYQAWEMILINDGSVDDSGKICSKYSENDERIRVIHSRNGGASVARNKGLDIAGGEYITFLDSDDYWIDENSLQKLVERLEQSNADVLSFNFCKKENDEMKSPYFQITISQKSDLSNKESLTFATKNGLWIACAWNKIIKRTLFENHDLQFVEGLTAEDVGWSARLALVVDRMDYLNVPIVAYVQRGDSITGSLNEKKIKALKENIDTVFECCSLAQAEKKELLSSYMAYQVGVFLYDVAGFEELKIVWRKDIEKYLPFLKKSNSLKIKLFYWINKIFGLKFLFFIIKIYRKIIK